MSNLYASGFLGLTGNDAQMFLKQRPETSILDTIKDQKKLHTFLQLLKNPTVNFPLVPNTIEVDYLGRWYSNPQKTLNSVNDYLLWSNTGKTVPNLETLLNHALVKVKKFNSMHQEENLKKLFSSLQSQSSKRRQQLNISINSPTFPAYFRHVLKNLNINDLVNEEFVTQQKIPNNILQKGVYLPQILSLPNQLRIAYQIYYHSCSFIEASTGFGKSTCTPLAILAATDALKRIAMGDTRGKVKILMTCPRVNAAMNAFERLQTFQKRLWVGKESVPKIKDELNALGYIYKEETDESGYRRREETGFFHPKGYSSRYPVVDVSTDGKAINKVVDYDCLIIDEYHEHGDNMELILAKYLKSANERAEKNRLTHISLMTATFSKGKITKLYHGIQRLFSQYGTQSVGGISSPRDRMPDEQTFYIYLNDYNAKKRDVIKIVDPNHSWYLLLDKYSSYVGDYRNVLFFKPRIADVHVTLNDYYLLIKKFRPHENALFLGYYSAQSKYTGSIINNIKEESRKIIQFNQHEYKKYIIEKWKLDENISIMELEIQVPTIRRIVSHDPTSFVRVYIFSTSIAEASVTIDELGFVVDDKLGFQKELFNNMFYGAKPDAIIDRNRQKQRIGRVGRQHQGVYITTELKKNDDSQIDSAPIEYLGLPLETIMSAIKLGLTRDDFVFKPPLDLWNSVVKYRDFLGGNIEMLKKTSEQSGSIININSVIDPYAQLLLEDVFDIKFKMPLKCRICGEKAICHDAEHCHGYCKDHFRNNSTRGGVVDLLSIKTTSSNTKKLKELSTTFLFSIMQPALRRDFKRFEMELYNALIRYTFKLCMQNSKRKFTLYKNVLADGVFVLVEGNINKELITVVETELINFKSFKNKKNKYDQYQVLYDMFREDIIPLKTMLFTDTANPTVMMARRMCATTIITYSHDFYPSTVDIQLCVSKAILQNIKKMKEGAELFQKYSAIDRQTLEQSVNTSTNLAEVGPFMDFWGAVRREKRKQGTGENVNRTQGGGANTPKNSRQPLRDVSFFRIDPSHLNNKNLCKQVTLVLKEGFGNHADARNAISEGHIGVCMIHKKKVVGVVSLAKPGTTVGVYKIGRRVFEEDWYLHDLAVLKEFRGRRVGRRLVEKANELLEGKVCLVPGDNLDDYYLNLGWSARKDGLWVKK